MTVKSEVSRVSYAGNGSSTLFAVPFYFVTPSDLRVMVRAADGSETLLGPSDYTVSGAGVETGGSVTLSIAPVSTATVVIYRDVPMTQTADYVEGGRFPATAHERALDRIVMMVQRIADMCMRGLKLGETDVAGAGRFRAGGNRISELANPINNDDAVNLGYFITHASITGETAASFAIEAEASADAAAASASQAAGYATSSAVAATTATTAAADAATAAANATAAAGFDPALFLLKSGNLSGLSSQTTARANLGLATVAATGSYNDLTNKPTIISTTWDTIVGKPTFAAVATTGAYGSLSGLPTLGNAASRNVGTVSGTVAAGDDARFDQSSKAPLVSPSFSGVPTAPTAPNGTNNQQIATTAFVMAQSASSTTAYLGIGTYIFGENNGGFNLNPGDTLGGGNLFVNGAPIGVGTWRAMGTGAAGVPTLWLRIS